MQKLGLFFLWRYIILIDVMHKKTLWSLTHIGVSVIISTMVIVGGAHAQEDEFGTRDDTSYYQLASPGILSDHPLYVFKQLRDFIIEMATKDPGEKSSLYLEYADKRMAQASQLLEKGKTVAAIDAVVESQEIFEKIPGLMQEARESDSELEEGFLEKLKLSNEKHYDLASDIWSRLPADNVGEVEQAMQTNREIREKLESM